MRSLLKSDLVVFLLVMLPLLAAAPLQCTSESRGNGATAFDGELCARTGVVYLRLPEGIAPLYERDGSLVTCVP